MHTYTHAHTHTHTHIHRDQQNTVMIEIKSMIIKKQNKQKPSHTHRDQQNTVMIEITGGEKSKAFTGKNK